MFRGLRLFADLAEGATIGAGAPVLFADFLSAGAFVVVVVDVPLAAGLGAGGVVGGDSGHSFFSLFALARLTPG
jgi:hypothetical protein